MQANLQANTFVVSGTAEEKKAGYDRSMPQFPGGSIPGLPPGMSPQDYIKLLAKQAGANKDDDMPDLEVRARRGARLLRSIPDPPTKPNLAFYSRSAGRQVRRRGGGRRRDARAGGQVNIALTPSTVVVIFLKSFICSLTLRPGGNFI